MVKLLHIHHVEKTHILLICHMERRQLILSTSVMWRNVKMLHIHHVETTPILHICHVDKSEFSPHDGCGAILDFSTWQMWKNLKFLHMTDFFSTGTTCGTCDKYHVCQWIFVTFLSLCNRPNRIHLMQNRKVYFPQVSRINFNKCHYCAS